MKIFKKVTMLVMASLFATVSSVAGAADPSSCRAVRFADVGWTDIAATTAVATTVLEGLGYKPTATIASVPITFFGIKKKNIDVFLGYWNPSMTPMIEPFLKEGSIKVLEPGNLTGAKYTLAVPAYLAEAGLKDFADISKFRNELGGKIYGIEPGNDGNMLIQKMIANNEFGLGGFKLVESSEAGMLLEVQRAIRQNAAIVFLGWEPHPMNEKMKLAYLTGGDKYFGPNLGGATIYTAMWPGYADKCPNAAKLVSQLKFSLPMENQIMGQILDKVEPVAAAKDWLRKNPTVLDAWLTGVTTFDGADGLPAVKKHLGVM